MNASRLRLPSLDGLLAFEAAARHGAFERAADELCVTGSAIAKRVAAVEQLLGVQLLVRNGKSLTLTSAGIEYLDQVRGPLRLLAAVPLHQKHGKRKERLRVCSPPTFARQIIMPRLEAFTAVHPELEFEIVLAAPNADSPAPDSDIWIRGGDPVIIGGTVLMLDCITPLAAPSLLRRHGPMREPSDLASMPLLRTPLEHWMPWFHVANLDWPEPPHGPKLMDLGLLLEAAASGQGVALGSPALARHWLTTGTLVPVFPLIVCPGTPYCLMSHSSEGATGAFARWLVEICQQAVQQASEFLSRQA
ncbi:LysR substrate-binding domain-containing protein [Burkholderia stagnalis]|uniref:LysR substrate-binding domain-containing protein n=1 Tax=Burkholderia stagnalis TaxID=1503054 RepID=UPI0007551FA3|nr:LysR substrate-binding domain-containing protein [Burkholderia stagnalis]KVN13260.1 LysR family transcriptional regulator [Burkholderia stagnalis]KVN51065.1 LysR family transcriptional regulator [Burkholderia stagnalis]